jgi:hypothetical protein
LRPRPTPTNCLERQPGVRERQELAGGRVADFVAGAAIVASYVKGTDEDEAVQRLGERSREPEFVFHELLDRTTTAGLPGIEVVVLFGGLIGRAEEDLLIVLSWTVGTLAVELDEGRRQELGVPRVRDAAEAADGLGRQVGKNFHDDVVRQLRDVLLVFARHGCAAVADGSMDSMDVSWMPYLNWKESICAT